VKVRIVRIIGKISKVKNYAAYKKIFFDKTIT